jgi:hypothetical protein
MRIASIRLCLVLLAGAICNSVDGAAEPSDRSQLCGGQTHNGDFADLRVPVGSLVLVLTQSGMCEPIERVIWPSYRVSIVAQGSSQGDSLLVDLSPVTSRKILVHRDARTVFVVEGDSFKEIIADAGTVRVRTLFSAGQDDLHYAVLPRLGTADAAPQPISSLAPDFPVEVTSAPWLSFGEGLLFDLRSKMLHRFDPTAGGALELWHLVGLAPRERTLFWIGAPADDTLPRLVATDIVSGSHQVPELDPRRDDLPYDGELQFHTGAIDGAWIARHVRSQPQADGSLRIERRSVGEAVPRGISTGADSPQSSYALSCFEPSLRAAVADLLQTEFQATLLRTTTLDRSQDIAFGKFACGASADTLEGFLHVMDEYEIDGVPIELFWERRGTLNITGALADNEPPKLRWRVPARAMIIKAIGEAIDARLAQGLWRHHLRR